MQRSAIWSTTVLMLLISSCLFATSLSASEPEILSSYVLMAHSDIEDATVPLVRTILAQPAADCPTIEVKGSSTIAMMRRENPNPAGFGVAVCEAVVRLTAGQQATVQGKVLPIPTGPNKLKVEKLVVLGDSGCKEPKQDCDTGWAYPGIIKAAAAEAPDLVIHVGDYNYRGTPSKTGAGEWSYDGCLPADGGPVVRQSTYDTWATWNADFFTPAQPLLDVAPWVVTRGNHELCSRSGRGWFYLLDPHSPLLNPYRQAPGCRAASEQVPPFRLAFANLDLLMLDTANACGGEDPQSKPETAYEIQDYSLQLNSINALAARSTSGTAWLVGHRPIWSVYQQTGSAPVTQNQTMQPALAMTPDKGLVKEIDMVLSGHMHQFFSLSWAESGKPQPNRPPQLVIGNSGVALSGNDLPSPWSATVDGQPATGMSAAETTALYGYLTATVTDGGHWQGTIPAFDTTGKSLGKNVAHCALPITDGHLCQAP